MSVTLHFETADLIPLLIKILQKLIAQQLRNPSIQQSVQLIPYHVLMEAFLQETHHGWTSYHMLRHGTLLDFLSSNTEHFYVHYPLSTVGLTPKYHDRIIAQITAEQINTINQSSLTLPHKSASLPVSPKSTSSGGKSSSHNKATHGGSPELTISQPSSPSDLRQVLNTLPSALEAPLEVPSHVNISSNVTSRLQHDFETICGAQLQHSGHTLHTPYYTQEHQQQLQQDRESDDVNNNISNNNTNTVSITTTTIPNISHDHKTRDTTTTTTITPATSSGSGTTKVRFSADTKLIEKQSTQPRRIATAHHDRHASRERAKNRGCAPQSKSGLELPMLLCSIILICFIILGIAVHFKFIQILPGSPIYPYFFQFERLLRNILQGGGKL